MLRRLVHRFSEQGGDGGGAQTIPPGFQNDGRISSEVVQDIELDVESEEDDTERWIIEAGVTSDHTASLASDARTTGRRVWVPDDEVVWRMAGVVAESADGSSYTVLSRDGKVEHEIPVGQCADYDPSHALDLADASRMNQMHEAPLLDLLHRRFQNNAIYTNVADVLVSINPYADIPGLYDIPMPVAKPAPVSVRGPSAGGRVAQRSAALMREFKDGANDKPNPAARKGAKGGKGNGESDAKSQLTALKSMLGKPHVYGVADRAFKYMAETGGREVDGRIRRRNQSILITGESGAGKTEASKHVMRFLITASRALAGTAPVRTPPTRPLTSYGDRSSTSNSTGGKCRWRSSSPVITAAAAAKHMEDVLLRSNTVLEAFGNAKTVRNDNSSRFGKYIKLQYDPSFRLVGARTEHFLLEKSRLVHLEESERSYHILYQVAKALPAEEKKAFHLARGAECFSLLNQGNCLEASHDMDDREEFLAVDKALSSLDFSAREKTDMWRLLAAILHSGEVRFEDVPGQEQCRISKGKGRNSTSLSPAELASMWGVNQAVFEAGVMKRTVTAGGTSASVDLNAAQAKENLLALLKHMYRQLFAWINWKINVVFDVPTSATKEVGAGAEQTFIGILDIFGFEIMTTNSFEQLCINFANEVLQRQFNHHIFVLEQEEYGAEGLDVASIPFRDNQPIIDLIARRPAGLMPILEDQALTGRKAASLKSSFTDKNLLELFHQQHHRKAPHPCYRKPRFDGPEFVIMHYAGDVTYNATGFLEKNTDTLQEDLRGLLLSSQIPFLRQLILGEGGVFEKEDAEVNVSEEVDANSGKSTMSLAASGQSIADSLVDINGSIAKITKEETGRKRTGNPKSFAAPNAISKRVNYPYGDAGKAARGSAIAGNGDRAGGTRTLKRGPTTKIAAKATVSNAFRSQLDDLVAQLSETEPHYIKCIKPNADKAPGGWTGPLVIEQLRYSGVLEVVRIRREAFPMRVTYKQFYRRFGTLLLSRDLSSADDVTSAQARTAGLQICKAVFGAKEAGSSFQMGKTKIFLRDDGLKRLRAALRLHYFTVATMIQALWRGALARATLARQNAAAGKLQQLARGNMARRRYPFREMRRATLVLQAVARMKRARALIARKQASAVKIQAVWRGWRQRGWLERSASATRLQAVARGFIARRRRERTIAAITLQAASRAKAARKKLAAIKKQKDDTERAAATRIAAVWRGKSERMFGADRRAKEAKRQLLSGWTLRDEYLREESSATRAQKAIRTFLRNHRLRVRSIQIFEATRMGDVPTVAGCLSEWPALLFLRDRHDGDLGAPNFTSSSSSNISSASDRRPPSYSTLLHAACQGGAIEVVSLLEPFLSDIVAKDRWGNTAVHIAAAGCHYELLKLLARRANLGIEKAVRAAANGRPAPRPEAFPLGMSKEAFVLAAGMVRRLRLAEAVVPCHTAQDKEGGGGGGGSSTATGDMEGSWDEGSGEEGGESASEEQRVATLRMESLRLESWEDGQPMVEGFLRKRRETDRWLKRWCQLKRFAPRLGHTGDKGPALFYYKKKGDSIPSKIIMLHHCLLKKSRDLDFTFELHSPLMMEGKNREGRLYFQAGDEVELQRWLVALRALVKFYDFKNEKRQLPMEYLCQGRRESLVRAKNNRGETPLHLAVACIGHLDRGSRGSSVDDGDDEREMGLLVQRVAAWLVENGAYPNSCDNQGETPMHCVMKAGNADAALELQRRRGNINLPRKMDWKTPLDLALGHEELRQRLEKEAESGRAPMRTVRKPADDAAATANAVAGAGSPLLPVPTKLLGFTYVSIFLETLSVASTVGMVEPSLTLSVLSAKGQLVEAAQEFEAPAMKSSSYLWWGRSWHMQTPLETLGSGTFVVFELRDLQGGNKKAICWGALPLDPDHLNTQPEQLSTYLAPTDPTRLSTRAIGSGCYGVAGGINVKGGSLPLRTDATLAADVFLTRMLK
ncbi:unnamed protein product [Scytosiphon promiscuus]